MNLPPPKPKTLLREMCLTVHCATCGKGIILASGYNAELMTRQRKFEIMLAMGWDIAPKFKCRYCAVPMDTDEIMEWKKLIPAPFINVSRFIKRMRAKYGTRCDKFFGTDEPRDHGGLARKI